MANAGKSNVNASSNFRVEPMEFSSDDDDSLASSKTRKRTAASKKKSAMKANVELEVVTSEVSSDVSNGFDVTQLSDAELSTMFKEYGVSIGPVVDSTRSVYQRKLLKIIANGGVSPDSSLLSAEPDNMEVDEEDDYSDDEDSWHQETASNGDGLRQRNLQTTSASTPAQKTVSPRADTSSDRKSNIQSTTVTKTEHFTTSYSSSSSGIQPREGLTGRPALQRDTQDWTRQTEYRATSQAKPQPASTTVPTVPVKRRWPIWVQVLLLILVAALIFVVIQNMEPAFQNPVKSIA